MKVATLFVLSVAALTSTCFGAEPDASVLAVGAWSQPIRTRNYVKLRGRFKICEYPNNRGLAPSIDVAVYVELQEFSDSVGGPVEVYFDPQALKCELTDTRAKPCRGRAGPSAELCRGQSGSNCRRTAARCFASLHIMAAAECPMADSNSGAAFPTPGR